MQLQEVFIYNLKEFRNRRSMTQSGLAEASDLSVGMIGQIESGAVMPSFISIDKLARALSVSPYQLFMDRSDHLNFRENEVSEFMGEIRSAIDPFIDRSKPTDAPGGY